MSSGTSGDVRIEQDRDACEMRRISEYLELFAATDGSKWL